ncbi:uncharacterized protein Z520_09584 [Fonsecaea multimorphosa CBS 102226]|uniref:Major facilitator superfamily (MFS) profile domain-containing protein n=1 Tax=Fonsecaea multimorphosa CBS 102226 TaxID=1442371 RepID=A0A0D2KCU6_9EURO|nr:uncharacterized protein Z520_09584 [Fonsecaea multimorphosa CBS 102226]KIX94538.1 hypothetical protein Z520_09584 [Fonsecaea multimorphosa CBS 102226]
MYFCQLVLVVGAGLLARSMVAVVGGESLSAWPTPAIGLMTAALCPIASQMADYWGRKWFLVILTGFGGIGSIIVSRATSFGMALAGFAIGGLSCVTQPLLHAVVSEVLPRKFRSWAQAAANIAAGLGAIYALLVGGALTANNPQHFRIYFYTAAGLYLAVSAACVLLYNPPSREAQTISLSEKLQSLDWIGYIMGAAGVSLLCIGLSWAENPYPWRDPHVLATFLLGVVILMALVVYEVKFKKDGLFHHSLFRHRNFPITLLCCYIEGSGAFAANYFVPLQLSTMYPQMDSFRVGLCYAISWIAFLAAALLVGQFIYKTKSVRIPAMTGFLLFLLFYILAATSKPSTPESLFWGSMIPLGAGLGLLLISLVTAAQFATPPELIAITSGLILSIRSLGASSGLVIYQAVFNAGLSKNLTSKIASATLPLGLPEASLGALTLALTSGNTAAATEVPGVTAEIIAAAALALQKAYNIALSYVWATAAALAFVALVAAAFLRDPNDEFTAAIDAPLDIVVVVADSELEAEDKVVAQQMDLSLDGDGF